MRNKNGTNLVTNNKSYNGEMKLTAIKSTVNLGIGQIGAALMNN